MIFVCDPPCQVQFSQTNGSSFFLFFQSGSGFFLAEGQPPPGAVPRCPGTAFLILDQNADPPGGGVGPGPAPENF